MKKLLITLTALFLTGNFVFADSIDSVIRKSPVSKNATVSVSVRELDSGHVVYEKDSNKLMNPASTLKAFTFPVILNQLGSEFTLKTQVYKYGQDTAYLKLSGDPFLTSRNTRHLIRALRNAGLKEPRKFYIDDTALDDKEYGIGWQWDDEFNTSIPKISSYNLDNNVYELEVRVAEDKQSVKVKQPYNYKVAIINQLKPGTRNGITVRRNFWEGAEKVTLTGTVITPTTIRIPTYNQKRYFISAIQENMENANVRYYDSFESKKVPEGAVLIQEYVTIGSPMYKRIMKNSNNLVTETLFKVAGGKYKNSQGTTAAGLEALKEYYKNIDVDIKDIVIVDASGISQNNLLSTDWMTDTLVKINKNDKNFDYKVRYNIPNEGTMVNRLFDLRDYLWAKTGTLSNTSGLTGYITTKSGNDYAFAILIQNSNLPSKDMKNLEDEIVTTIFKKY